MASFRSQWLSFLWHVRKGLGKLLGPKTGVGNSFGFAGHIRDKLGIHGPVHVHVN